MCLITDVCVCVYRFWAVFKNAMLLYALRPALNQFLSDHSDITNNLAHTLHMHNCGIYPEGAERVKQQQRVIAELRTMAAWQYALVGPALLAGARCMPLVNQQRKVVRSIHDMLHKVTDLNTDYAKSLITEQVDARGNVTHPVTFLSSLLDEMGMPKDMLDLKALHLLAYQRMCQSNSTDELVIDKLRISAAAMVKKQIDMSSDLLFKEAEQEFFGKAASNTCCERSFGFLDWWKKFASRQKTVRTNGLIMFKVNNTVDWLRAKSQEDRDRIMDVIRKWRYRKSKEAKEQKRELEMEAETRK